MEYLRSCFNAIGLILSMLVLLFISSCSTAAQPVPVVTATPISSSTPVTASVVAPTAAPVAPVITPNTTSTKSGVTIVVGFEPSTIDAFLETTTPFGQVATNFVETLTIPDALTNKPVPGSGFSKWEMREPTRWRWFLRPGIQFSNGEPWDAQAAKYSIDYVGNENNNAGNYGATGNISAEVVDDMTVDIVCQNVCPILNMTAMSLAFQAPEWHREAAPDQRAREAIGYGPYKLVQWEPSQFIKGTMYEKYVPASERYDYQQPTIKDITWVWRGEEEVRSAMVITGEADLGYGLPLEDIDRLPRHFLGTEGATYGFRLDTIWEPALKNVKMRQAMAHAIDCKAIAQTLFNGQTTCRGSVVSPGVLGVNSDKTPPYKYDTVLAKRLLSESNYAGQELKVYAREERRPKGVEVAEAAVNYWNEVGINAQLVVLESGEWTNYLRTGPGKYGKEALNAGSLPPPAPTNSSPQILSGTTMGSPDTRELGFNFSFYLNCYSDRSKVCEPEKIQSTLEAALEASGEERRKQLEELAQIVYDEVLVIPLFDTVTVWGIAQSLKWQPRLIDESIRVNTMGWVQ